MEGVVQGRTGDWGEVVTRYPYENVGMDHLLSMEKDRKENNLWKLGLKNKKLPKKAVCLNEIFYLVLRDCFSQILFFEN